VLNYLVLDVETESINKGHPFHPDNFLCTVHLISSTDGKPRTVCFSYPDRDAPLGEAINEVQEAIDDHDVLVGFNFKFDLHWLRRYGIKFDHKQVEDVQYLHYLLSNQQSKFPSLNMVCDHYGLDRKKNVVEEEYWSQGVPTSMIPVDILTEYGEYDVILTWECWKESRKELEGRNDSSLVNLFAIHMADLLVLEEMEANGMMYDTEAAEVVRKDTEEHMGSIDDWFEALVPGVGFNPGSNDQLSALLFGGKIFHKYYEHVGQYKTGARAGEDKFSPRVAEILLHQRIRPNKKWETKKAGYYSVSSDVLTFLLSTKINQKTREIITLVLERAKLAKLLQSYCNSINDLISSNRWEVKDGIAKLHGQLNQCVAITGRLASSKPNLQNMDGNIKYLFVTRFK